MESQQLESLLNSPASEVNFAAENLKTKQENTHFSNQTQQPQTYPSFNGQQQMSYPIQPYGMMQYPPQMQPQPFYPPQFQMPFYHPLVQHQYQQQPGQPLPPYTSQHYIPPTATQPNQIQQPQFESQQKLQQTQLIDASQQSQNFPKIEFNENNDLLCLEQTQQKLKSMNLNPLTENNLKQQSRQHTFNEVILQMKETINQMQQEIKDLKIQLNQKNKKPNFENQIKSKLSEKNDHQTQSQKIIAKAPAQHTVFQNQQQMEQVQEILPPMFDFPLLSKSQIANNSEQDVQPGVKQSFVQVKQQENMQANCVRKESLFRTPYQQLQPCERKQAEKGFRKFINKRLCKQNPNMAKEARFEKAYNLLQKYKNGEYIDFLVAKQVVEKQKEAKPTQKKGIAPYFIFQNEKRQEIEAESNNAAQKLIGAMWRALPQEQKLIYAEKAQILMRQQEETASKTNSPPTQSPVQEQDQDWCKNELLQPCVDVQS